MEEGTTYPHYQRLVQFELVIGEFPFIQREKEEFKQCETFYVWLVHLVRLRYPKHRWGTPLGTVE